MKQTENSLHLSIYCAFIIFAIMILLNGCENPVTVYELRETPEQSTTEIQVVGEDDEEEIKMSDYMAPAPIPDYDLYFQRGNLLYGIPPDIYAYSHLIFLGTYNDFKRDGDRLYFSDIEYVQPEIETDPWTTVKHFYEQDSGVLTEVPEYTIPDTDRFVEDFGIFRITAEDYQGIPISVPYRRTKRDQPVYMIDCGVMVNLGMLYNVAQGVSTRPTGLYLWQDNNRPPNRIGDAGRIW